MTQELFKTKGGLRYATLLTDATPKNVPIWNPNGLHHRWHLSEIYMGQEHIGEGNKGRYVGNPGDEVWDEEIGEQLIDELDPSTLIAKLRKRKVIDTGGADEINLILGVGPRHPQEGYFIYVNPHSEPMTLGFDAMMCFYQQESRYIRIFRSTDWGNPNAKCISGYYDQSGVFHDKIPLLKMESTLGPNNINSFWVPAVGCLTELPNAGDSVTVVCYNDADDKISVTTWVIHYGTNYRNSFEGHRTIRSIELVCPYPIENRTIIFPVGTLVQSATLMCKVTYTTGKEKIIPIDGNKVILSGDQGMALTQPGIDYPLSLIYNLDQTEQMEGAGSNDGTFHIEHYTFRTDSTAQRYGVKLYPYPEWVSEKRGWRYRTFAHTIDRDAVYEVTDVLELGANSNPWDPLLYGEKQRLDLALDMHRVDPRFINYRHVQSVDISLMGAATDERETPWLVQFTPGQSPAYGYYLKCELRYISSQVWETDVSSGIRNQEDWLKALYRDTLPLYSISGEEDILEPTHFYVVIEGFRYRRKVEDWNVPFQTKSGAHVGELCIIHWVRDVGDTELQLSTSAMMIRHIGPKP